MLYDWLFVHTDNEKSSQRYITNRQAKVKTAFYISKIILKSKHYSKITKTKSKTEM